MHSCCISFLKRREIRILEVYNTIEIIIHEHYIRIVHIIFSNLHYLSKTLVLMKPLNVNRWFERKYRLIKIQLYYNMNDDCFLIQLSIDIHVTWATLFIFSFFHENQIKPEIFIKLSALLFLNSKNII